MSGTGFSALCFAVTTMFVAGLPTSSALAASKAGKVKAAAAASKPSDKSSSRRGKAAPVDFQLAPAPLKLSLRDVTPTGAAMGPAVGFAPREDVNGREALVDAGFELSPAASYGDARLLDADRYYDGRGPVSWRSNAFAVETPSGAVNSVRVSYADVSPTAAIAPLTLFRRDANTFEARDVDVTVTRGWPAAVKFEGGRYTLDVTPHAGLGFGGAGGSAEAGATVRLGKSDKSSVEDRVAGQLGLRDGSEFGQRGRWYVFAAASGRAVGLNMLRNQDGDWSRAGLSQDVNSRLIGDAQAGVAWRKGPMQASVGYIHREIKAKDVIMGMATQEDSMVALSFSLKPHW